MPKGGSRIGAGRKPKARAAVAFTPGLAAPPAWLPAPARAYYRRYGAELEAAGVLTHADRDTLALYANTLADIAQLTKLMRAKTFTRTIVTELGEKTNPIVTQHQAATSKARMLAQDLGLTPASRSRVQVVSSKAATADPNDAKRQAFFGGPRLVRA